MSSLYKKPVFLIILLLSAGIALLAACSTSPPENIRDSCEIFTEKDDWYPAALDSYEKWGVPIHVQLAIIYQESRFVHDAKPPRTKLLWVIPWTRMSSAYGYGQIKDSTWDWYLKSTGRRWADRDDFDDVVDYISWYVLRLMCDIFNIPYFTYRGSRRCPSFTLFSIVHCSFLD